MDKKSFKNSKLTKLTRALISVSDKRNLNILGEYLVSCGVEMVSTGGTASFLRDKKFPINDVSEVTGFPEMMDGRVKTLHPRIHGGILFRRNTPADLQELRDYAIREIDLVVVNLYPFRKAVLSGKNYSDCIEEIDIGGPALIRAAAKNHENVCVIVDPDDYNDLIKELKNNDGKISTSFSKRMAIKAFLTVSNYDFDIQNWLKCGSIGIAGIRSGIKKEIKLRYGENPHQEAELLIYDREGPNIATSKKVQGKELSYNNYIDADSAFKIISEFNDEKEFACVIVKHKNPCGVAKAKTLHQAYLKANSCDPTSAFGGIVAVNSTLDAFTASEIKKTFTEVIIAPKISKEAKDIFKEKKNVRLLETFGLLDDKSSTKVTKEISGGILLQEENRIIFDRKKIKNVTNLEPNKKELDDMIFAWKIIKHVHSNAIIIVKDGQTIGIGGGQTSRLDSVRMAVIKSENFANNMEDNMIGAVAASDAFFPFSDGVIELCNAGVKAIIQPGGSINDEEIIREANKNNISMLFTGIRYFSH